MRIFLSGPMGSGKSTVARAVGEAAQLPVFDLDALIEEESGKTVAELFAQEGEPRVRINTDDAKDRDIAAGDRVRIFNDRGEVKLAAVPDDDLPRGVLAMTSGKWISRDGHSVNVLTHDDVTDIGYGAIFFDCLVQAEIVKTAD